MNSCRAVIGVAFVIASCARHSVTTSSGNACREAIEAFASGDPKRLRGLPASCSVDEVSDQIDPMRSRAVALGDPGTGYNLHELRTAKLKAMAWIKNGQVAMLDADEPPHSEEAYVAALGPPELKLDFTWRDIVRPNSDLLWLSKGVSLASSPELEGVLRVAVFAPTTLDEYKRALRFFDQWRDEP